MRLFYLINGWAGRNEFADAALRLFYVSAVPLLATVLAVFLILLPRRRRAASRWRVALATALAGALCIGTQVAVEYSARHYLNSEILSLRPFVTHYTNLLVVEPNDNSFPCPEVMLAGTLAVMIWATSSTAGMGAVLAVLLFCGARVFCGSNYVGDVSVGAAVGACWGALALALCHISIQAPLRDGRVLVWRVRPQGVLSGGTALIILIAALWPRFGPILRDLWSVPTATAAPASARGGRVSPHETALMTGATLPHSAEHEGGESGGLHSTHLSPIAAALRSRTAGLDGHLPDAEKKLSKALRALRLPHRILGVQVAQVRAGKSAYRCAAVYFEVRASGTAERRRVAATTTRIVKRAFHVDEQLQNIDVVGAILNDGSTRHASPYVFTIGEVPVFTASVARNKLRLRSGPQWLNIPNVDPGLWLRARSRLYINARVLPVAVKPAPTPQPTATPVPTALPTATPIPTATPRPTATPVPTAKPIPTAAPTAAPTRAPTRAPTPRPTARPVIKPHRRTTVPLKKPSGPPKPVSKRPVIKKPVIKKRPPVRRVLPRPRLRRQYSGAARPTIRRGIRRSKRRRASGYRRPFRSRSNRQVSRRQRAYYRR